MPNFRLSDAMNELMLDYDVDKNEEVGTLVFPYTKGEFSIDKESIPEEQWNKWEDDKKYISLTLVIFDLSAIQNSANKTFDGILVKKTDAGESIEYVVSVQYEAVEDNLIVNLPLLKKSSKELTIWIETALSPTEIKYYIDLLNRHDISRRLYFDYQDKNIKTHPLKAKIKVKQIKGIAIKSVLKYGFYGVVIYFILKFVNSL